MNILISSYPFHPSVGGVEEVTDLLANEYVARGHVVKIVTMTPSTAPGNYPFEVIRKPTARALVQAVTWCDVYVQHQISLRFAWPLLLMRRPWIAVQLHTLGNEQGILPRLRRSIKRKVIGLSRHVVACSSATAQEIGKGVTVIPDPYRDTQFRRLSGKARVHDLVFLGRLVSDKGIPFLIEALARLRERGITPSLMIIGGGPEAEPLRSLCEAMGIMEQVHFTGRIPRDAVIDVLNQCRLMVVPSTVEEGFGIVAVEGIACGCVVVAAAAGGLPEAVGPCGVTFPKGDAAALATCLADLLGDPQRIAALQAAAPMHLERHRPQVVADAYLRVIERARTGAQSASAE
jgi:glycosyltransferase involved in cell wall biosynthesis